MNFKNLFIEFSEEKRTLTSKKVDSNSNYYRIVMKDMRNNLKNYIQQTNLIVSPSVGRGNYADVPWICILSDNPRISPSAQKGIYIVLLFTKEGDAFYLTLGQVLQILTKRI
ncbi:MAG: DUF3578 domain-containing protein [Acholeplasmataceae bacterium]|jgi:hypothetical protein|nr:DUF3578 domain-containing protein [Acholeplasmataceae bacterium]